ncbi:hypothetical protein [Aliikangiella sp. IMCC44359]|uniref:hypothetical protein n=1 Tax=Aliikangiella sp. IMCC44359 TaxID=3459125 RepID=UPI00403ADE0C
MLNIKKIIIQWHRKLVWFAAFVLVVWGGSGMLHPIMSWTGPKAIKFFAPKLTTNSEQLNNLPATLMRMTQESFNVAKVVPSEIGPLLQITSKNANVREYYDLANGIKLADYDLLQARWLANYYTGVADSKIKSVELIDQFSAEYPWVNRLLPVYRVSYATDDELVAFVHTETSSLASLTNRYRSNIQTIFRALHTWNWADDIPVARVIVIALMMITALAMAIFGIGLIFVLRWRKIPNQYRRWHRVFSYFIWLPILAWSFSGFYHLLQYELVDNVAGMQLDKPLNLTQDEHLSKLAWIDRYKDVAINSMTLVRAPDDKLLFRLGIASDKINKVISKKERFIGIPKEKRAIYIDASNGKEYNINDKERAKWLTVEHLNITTENIKEAKLITHFGNGYDFRNKRLPVWRIAIDDNENHHLFIDPITGILVDKNRTVDRVESWSFSILHKWNILTPLVGRFIRDIIIVITVLLIFAFVGIGIKTKLSQKSR